MRGSKRGISKNQLAEEVMGKRKPVIPVFMPVELGYRCPLCKQEGETLEFSEYNGFLWCETCNLDIPSCLCVWNYRLNIAKRAMTPEERIEEATYVYLKTVEEATRRLK